MSLEPVLEDLPCSICLKRVGDHSPEEVRVCFLAFQLQMHQPAVKAPRICRECWGMEPLGHRGPCSGNWEQSDYDLKELILKTIRACGPRITPTHLYQIYHAEASQERLRSLVLDLVCQGKVIFTLDRTLRVNDCSEELT